MSKMGQAIFEIQEMYSQGYTIEAIVKLTGSSASFVNDVIEEYSRWYDEPTIEDYPEPEGDF